MTTAREGPPTTAAQTHGHPHKGWALTLLATVQLMIVLDIAIVNVALPTIQQDLGFSDASLQWVVNAYTLMFGGFLLLGGRLADKLGRRRVFFAGMALFTLASFLGGLSQNDTWLIFARGLQGLGGAVLAPATLAIIATTFTEGAERNKAMGVFGAVAGSGGAIGVLLGGVLTELLSWQWILFVNVPVGVAVMILTPRLLGESRSDEAHGFDVAGATTLTGGLVALVYGFVKAAEPDHGWSDPWTIWSFVVAAVLLVAGIWIEARARSPLMPLSVFRRRNLTGANVVGLLVGASLFSMFYLLTLYMQKVLGYSALEAGLAYLPLSFGIIVSAGVASQLVTRVGVRPVIVPGLILSTIGLLMFTQIEADGSYVADILVPSVIVAIGLGATFVPLIIAATAGVGNHDAGLASGLIQTAQQVGGSLGLAILVTVATNRSAEYLTELGAQPTQSDVAVATVRGFQAAFFTGSVLIAIGALVAFLVIRVGRDEAAAAAKEQAGAVA